MLGKEHYKRSRLVDMFPLGVFIASIVLYSFFVGLHSTMSPASAVDDDVSFASTSEGSPLPPPSNTLLSDHPPGNASRAGAVGGSSRPSTGETMVDCDDEELLRRASSTAADTEEPTGGCPRKKVAFMFLTKGRMPLRRLWEKFFKGHQEYFSIYLHTSPEFTEEPPEESVFFGRRIASKPMRWGRASMVDAERRLLANALLDACNERFILLSESCIPLYNFTTVYRYLLGSALSFVSAFDDPTKVGRGRYNRRMYPLVTLQDWRKGSQWFVAHRRLASIIVSDRVYYPVFRDNCLPPCYMDEHYVPTLVMKLLPSLNANRSLTWVDWSRGGSHPASFRGRQVSGNIIKRIRKGSGCADAGSATSVCFLFARKFEGSSLGPLLRMTQKVLRLDL